MAAAFAAAESTGLAFLSPIGPLVLAAAWEEIAQDSRKFARVFDVEHALVIRECVHLASDLNLITLTYKNERSSRVGYELNDKGLGIFNAGPLAPV